MPLDGVDPLPAPNGGCLYLLENRQACGCTRQSGGSPYCFDHHALCHLVPGSQAERSRFAEIARAAEFVGGRVSRAAPRVPPQRFMRALDARQRQR
jgi:hypothetical protein